jgi:hypothetical protein
MIRQVKTVPTPVKSVIRSAAFVKGFNEVRKGVALNYDAFKDANKQWNYERGRLFAHSFSGQIKVGNRVTHDAIVLLGRDINSGVII